MSWFFRTYAQDPAYQQTQNGVKVRRETEGKKLIKEIMA
jgi:hypothetical protein